LWWRSSFSAARAAYGVVVALLALSLLAGCSGGEAHPAAQSVFETQSQATDRLTPEVDRLTIALIMKTLTNPFFIEMEKGARRAQDEFDINLIVKTGAQETSIEQQIAIVEDLIAADVDAIVIAPGSSTELIPVLKRAQDAGIVVINIDNRLDRALSVELGLVGVPFISVDNEHGAYLSAKCLADRISEPTDVAILEGIREAMNAQERKAGSLRAFAENPLITVVECQSANWKIDEGHAMTRQMLEYHPTIKAIFAANDMMGLGAVAYLAEAGRTDVAVAGYDALADALDAIREGKMLCTIDQQPAEQGYLGIQSAVRALAGEALPEEIMLDVLLITAENAP